MSLWESMDDEARFYTLQNMGNYGGSFATNIANAWIVADSCNSARLAAAFPDLIEKFQPKNWSTTCADTQLS